MGRRGAVRGNQFGELFSITTFGESHGPALGVVIDGCPAGVEWRQDLMDRFLARRRPGANPLTSGRAEGDVAHILSGVFENKTLGTPIAAVIYNEDARSQDYSTETMKVRRGHATDLWADKYGHSDPRGSGRASGRETVGRVLAGSVARMLVEQLYPQIRVLAFTSAIGEIALNEEESRRAIESLRTDPWEIDDFSLRCPEAEKNAAMEVLLRDAKEKGESFGGVASLSVQGLPAGIGQPVFGKLKNSFANACLSVGATMGFEIGEGFPGTMKSGTEFHDSRQDYGGLRGGISTGDALSFRVAFKPTSTVGDLAKQGRHDPCIIPRALPVLEAMLWLVLADQILFSRIDTIKFS
jgi:chorismate synthase